MNEQDGYRVEAALQFGATPDDDCEKYTLTEVALIAFAKACERKGLAEAHGLANRDAVHRRILDIDAELAPIREVERQRCLAARPTGPGLDPYAEPRT